MKNKIVVQYMYEQYLPELFFGQLKQNDRREDKMEEYFVGKFGNWIKNNAKEDFRNIFNDLKDKIFKDLEKVEDYQLYDLTDKEWDNKNLDVMKDNNSEKNKKEKEKNDDTVKRTLIDYVFIIFLKEISENTNKKYFEFIQKFILLYRKFIK